MKEKSPSSVTVSLLSEGDLPIFANSLLPIRDQRGRQLLRRRGRRDSPALSLSHSLFVLLAVNSLSWL